MITKRSTTQSLEDRGPRYSRHQGVLWMLVCKDCRGITICAWHLDDADDDDDETTAMISVLILTIHGWHYWHYISNEFAIYFIVVILMLVAMLIVFVRGRPWEAYRRSHSWLPSRVQSVGSGMFIQLAPFLLEHTLWF